MYVLEWRGFSALTRGLFWCLFPELQSNEGNKYQNNTWVRAETVRHESTYIIILFLTRHNKYIMTIKTTIFTHCIHVSLTQFLFCWWHHNRLLMTSQWPDNCDAIMWIVISNTISISILFTMIFTAGHARNISTAVMKFYALWEGQALQTPTHQADQFS